MLAEVCAVRSKPVPVCGDEHGDESLMVEFNDSDQQVIECLRRFVAVGGRKELGASPLQCVKNWLKIRAEEIGANGVSPGRFCDELRSSPGWEEIQQLWFTRARRLGIRKLPKCLAGRKAM